MSTEDAPLPIPDIKYPQYAFILSSPQLSHLHDGARADLVKGLVDDGERQLERVAQAED